MRASVHSDDKVVSSVSDKLNILDGGKVVNSDKSKSGGKDSSHMSNTENLKIGVQKRVDESSRNEIDLISHHLSDDAAVGVENTDSSKSRKNKSKLVQEDADRRYQESFLDSSLRFFASLATLWNPMSRVDDARNATNSHPMEYLDKDDNQLVKTTVSEYSGTIANIQDDTRKDPKAKGSYILVT